MKKFWNWSGTKPIRMHESCGWREPLPRKAGSMMRLRPRPSKRSWPRAAAPLPSGSIRRAVTVWPQRKSTICSWSIDEGRAERVLKRRGQCKALRRRETPGCEADGAQTDVTVRIDGIAASAASVIAMAGTKVQMSPVSVMMIHNPLTVAMGDSDEMRRAIQLLDEVKESIINAYEIKTGLSRARLSHLMDGETWMNAKKALELGFCDEILYQPEAKPAPEDSFTFSRRAVTNSLLDKLKTRIPKPDNRVSATDLHKRLSRLLH